MLLKILTPAQLQMMMKRGYDKLQPFRQARQRRMAEFFSLNTKPTDLVHPDPQGETHETAWIR